jgi:hypothetical protein
MRQRSIGRREGGCDGGWLVASAASSASSPATRHAPTPFAAGVASKLFVVIPTERSDEEPLFGVPRSCPAATRQRTLGRLLIFRPLASNGKPSKHSTGIRTCRYSRSTKKAQVAVSWPHQSLTKARPRRSGVSITYRTEFRFETFRVGLECEPYPYRQFPGLFVSLPPACQTPR